VKDDPFGVEFGEIALGTRRQQRGKNGKDGCSFALVQAF